MASWHSYYHELSISEYLSNLYGQRDFLVKVVDETPAGGTVLEVGTGTGSMSIWLSQLGLRVTALDQDTQVLALAKTHNRKFGGQVSEWKEGDAFHLPFPDASFDTVFHQGLLEHFNNDEIKLLLEEQLRVASKVIFSVPNNLYPTKDYGNERLMSARSWRSLLEGLGFKVIEAKSYSKKFFPKWYLPRVKIQNLLIVEG